MTALTVPCGIVEVGGYPYWVVVDDSDSYDPRTYVQSKSQPEMAYLLRSGYCPCEAAKFRRGKCSHSEAAALFREQRELANPQQGPRLRPIHKPGDYI